MNTIKFAILLMFEYYRTISMGTINRIKVKRRSELSLAEVLHALADPLRLEIVRQLDAASEKACGTFGVDVPKSSLSHHFRVLRRSGVIVSETKGTIIMNRLQRKDLDARFPGLLTSILGGAHQEHGK